MADMKSEKEHLNAMEDLFQQKRFSAALDIARKASSDYPNSYPIKFLFVRTLKQLNKLAEAEEVLKELMLMYPNNINLLLERGNLAVLRNKFDEGIEFYNKILFLDPFNTEAKDSIEKIEKIKKNGPAGKGKGDFLSFQNEKLHSADTLPEFDSRELRDMISEEPPPPPPPPAPEMKEESPLSPPPVPEIGDIPEILPPSPPPVPEMKEEPPFSPPPVPELKEEPSFTPPPAPEMGEIPEMKEVPEKDTDETEAGNFSHQKIQEQEVDEIEIPPPISNMKEMDDLPEREAEDPETPPIPEYEIQPIQDVEKQLEEINEYAQKEHQEPQIEETEDSLSIPESEPWGKIQEQEPDLNAAPSSIPDVTGASNIPEELNEMKQVVENQELEEKMEETDETWQEESGNDEQKSGNEEPGFVTESAAELYVEQGLLKDAVAIYEKLYDSRKEERFLSKIEELKRVMVNQKKIQVLNELLKHFQQIGEKIV
jgi:tetratricopeptide (TPR) repeat protein